MRIKFQADNDLKYAIISGVRRRQAAIDFQTAEMAQLHFLSDEEVLSLAANEGRVLVSHDHRTMPSHFAKFIATQNSPGVILIAQNLPLREAIEDLLMIWEASTAEEWINHLEFIPL